MRAATVRGLARSPTAGVFSEINEAFTPRSLPNLAAWFDALDTSSMLTGTAATVADGEAVALWKDKSGNSEVNCLILSAATGNRAALTTGTAIGTGDVSCSMTFRVPTAAATAGLVSLSASPSTNNQARALFAETRSNGEIWFTLIGATTADTRILKVTGFQTAYANQIVTVTYTRTGNTFAAYVTVGGVTATLSGSESTAGTPPNWGDTVTSTYTNFGFNASAEAMPSGIFRAAVYSKVLTAGEIVADAAGTQQADSVVFVDFTTAGVKLANGDTFVCTTGQTVTLVSTGATGARIAGERDLFQGTAANRPVYLAYSGTKYGYLNGTAGNYFSTPDSAGVSVTGDIDLRWYGALADYTPANNKALVCKWYDASGRFGYVMDVNATGNVRLVWSPNGTSGIAKTSTAALTTTDGSPVWIRATLDIDNGAVGNDVKFYTSPDGITWTQLGNTVTTAGTTSIYDNGEPLTVGAELATSTSYISGKTFRAQVYNGIAGTLVADFNPAIYTSGTTFTASTGEVWTINGGATIVTRTCNYGDGSNDSLKSAAYSCTQPTTLYWVGTMESWTASDYLIDGGGTNGGAIVQTTSTPQVNLNAGSSVAGNTNAALKTWGVFCAVLNGASSTLRWMRLPVTTGDAGAGNMNGMTLLARGAADAGWLNGCVGEVAQYSGAHSIATQDRWALYAGRKRGFSV